MGSKLKLPHEIENDDLIPVGGSVFKVTNVVEYPTYYTIYLDSERTSEEDSNNGLRAIIRCPNDLNLRVYDQ